MTESTDSGPAPGHEGKPAPPRSPAITKRPGKSPRDVELEKKISVLEDKVDGLVGWKAELDRALADLATTPAPAAAAKTRKTLLDELAQDLGFES